jgi:PIN domain nuclease of toxin-antitoxin system
MVSAVSLWEIVIKHSFGKLPLSKPPSLWLLDVLQEMGWATLSIDPLHVLCLSKLPLYHKDPFDRLLVAQSQTEDIPIITPDKKFKKYDVEIVW